MRNICDGLSKDLFVRINEKHPFCDDISKQYWLAIAGGPGMIYLSINHPYLYNCHRQYIISVFVIAIVIAIAIVIVIIITSP
jgi:hypothetical protein